MLPIINRFIALPRFLPRVGMGFAIALALAGSLGIRVRASNSAASRALFTPNVTEGAHFTVQDDVMVAIAGAPPTTDSISRSLTIVSNNGAQIGISEISRGRAGKSRTSTSEFDISDLHFQGGASTSMLAPFYNARLLGMPPEGLENGSVWKHTVTDSWDLCPGGAEMVRVKSLDSSAQKIVLEVDGSGVGTGLDVSQSASTAASGQVKSFQSDSGHCSWHERLTYVRGLLVNGDVQVTQATSVDVGSQSQAPFTSTVRVRATTTGV